jgi:hypothetical protein
VYLVQAHYTRVGVIHRGCGLDVVRIEGFREPQVDEFW